MTSRYETSCLRVLRKPEASTGNPGNYEAIQNNTSAQSSTDKCLRGLRCTPQLQCWVTVLLQIQQEKSQVREILFIEANQLHDPLMSSRREKMTTVKALYGGSDGPCMNGAAIKKSG